MLVAALLPLLGSCETVEGAREYFRDPTPHESYVLGLAHAGLAETALGSDWIEVAEAALRAPLPVDPPYREEGFFDPEEPVALGYRVALRRGERLEVSIDFDTIRTTRIFVDLFRAAPDSARRPAPVAQGDSTGSLAYEPRRSGEYVIRVQPELLRGGRYRLTIRAGGALAFPVDGHDTGAIRSYFGADRDGGRRRHHGVDIFASRGTPVLAPAAGTVRRVGETGLGGRVVWIWDAVRRQSYYYAHLDRQFVSGGEWVEPGDTLGLVGNTGNARTTPPHLHFGIYARGEGPIDPVPFLQRPVRGLESFGGDLSLFGEWVRVRADGSLLRRTPSRSGDVLADLGRHTAARVEGGAGSWYRVRLPDGRVGFLAVQSTEPVTRPLRTTALPGARTVQALPRATGPVREVLAPGTDVEVLGLFDDYLYVRPSGGPPGWMAAAGALD